VDSSDQALRAFTYARQSKDHDAGIGRQQEDTDGLASRRGYVIPEDGRFADNDRGASKSQVRYRDGVPYVQLGFRPGYQRMIERVRRGECDVLILTYLDRIYRHPLELEIIIPEIEKAGVLVVTVYEGDIDLRTDTGQMQARVKVAFARAEVMRKANRQKRANLDRARKGDRTPHGIRPFGYRDDRITLDDDEAEAIQWASSHILSGGSVSAILRDWTNRGVKPRFDGRTRRDRDDNEIPFSGRWTHASVTRILTNPRIAGLNTLPNSADIIGEGNWTPIITPETWAAVKDILSDPGRAAPRGNVSLGGFLFYCRCGAKVQRDTRYRGRKGDPNRTGIPIYKCLEYTAKAEGRPGPHVTIAASQVDRYVEMRLLDRMREPDAAQVFERKRDGTADVPKLKQERKEISDGLARMAGDEAMGILPRSIYLDAAKRVTARLEEIDAQMAEAGKVDAAALLLSADDPADVWATLDVTVQRKIIESVMHITLRPPGCGCRNPDLTQVVRVAWRQPY
jgi:DNA invertase Pin-like site-specific DNA recombinase